MTTITRRLTTAALLACGLLALAAASPAHAGTYSVRYCDAVNPSAAGWTPTWSGSAWTYYGDTCASGGSLQAWFDPGQPHDPGTSSQWSIDAPQDTTLAAISAYREWRADSYQFHGDSHAVLFSDKGRVDGCTVFYGCYGINGTGAWDLADARTVGIAVQCTGSGCPPGEVYNRLSHITLTIRDPHAPTLSQVGGPLASPTTTTRYRSLSYNATDRGGGIYRRRLVIDGAAGAPTVIDANGGACTQPATTRVPCRLSVADTFTFDTATLPDGEHTVALRVSDITDDNHATSPTWTIAVDNQPPALEMPVVAGSEARVGTPLTCTASAAGQDPTLAYQWVRANPDGSAETPITDATNAKYTPTDPDAGRKLLCRVTATDGGGTTTRSSSLTSGPFADGQTVKSYCDGQPTAPTDPCGDYDRDGIPNHTDPDDDNDGMPDDRDPRPHHDDTPSSGPAEPKDPSPPTPAPAAAPAAPAATPAPAATHHTTTQTVLVASSPAGMPVLSHHDGIHGPPTNGTRATNKTAMTLSGARSRRVNWGRRVRTTGRLLNVDGQPITGALITIQQRAIVPRRSGYAPSSVLRTVGSVRTDGDGRFRWTAQNGPSREIIYTYKANPANATVQGIARLRLSVRSKITLRAKRRTLHNGDTLKLTGRVHNRPLPTSGVVVSVQAYVRGRGWVVFATPRTDSKGRFNARYRFRDTTRTTRYRIRAITRMDTGAPFLARASRTVRVKVAP